MTPAGEDLYQRIEPHVAAIQRQLLKRLKADERKQLIYLISKAMGVGAAQFDAPRTDKKT
jgi:DNA-binding MarR family transcriptional regulator